MTAGSLGETKLPKKENPRGWGIRSNPPPHASYELKLYALNLPNDMAFEYSKAFQVNKST